MITLLVRSSFYIEFIDTFQSITVRLIFFLVVFALMSGALEPLYNVYSGVFKWDPFKSEWKNILEFVAKCAALTMLIFTLCSPAVARIIIEFMMKATSLFR